MTQPASSGSGERMPAIDVHTHMIPTCVGTPGLLWGWNGRPVERRGDGQLDILGSGRKPFGKRHSAARVADRLRDMDEAGVDLQVLSLLPPLWSYGMAGHDTAAAAKRSNDELVTLAEAHPTRFRVFAHLPLDDPAAAIAELERVMASDMVVGAAVGTHVDGRHWDEPELFPILEAAERLSAPLFFHPMAPRLSGSLPRYHLRNLIGNPTETTIAIADLVFGGVLERLPGLKTIFAHGGGYSCLAAGRFDHGHSVRPEAQEHVRHEPSAYLGRMYFDNLLHNLAAMRYLVDTVGIDQVVLGTDYPADMSSANPVRPVLEFPGFSDSEKRAILGGNLAALLGLDPAAVGRQAP
jgi:aminocarboxymuconate-semialdehyde decarboxylase